VESVTPGQPADIAGLQAGDLITKVDGMVVADSTQLIVTIRAKAPGDTVNLTVERDGQEAQIPLTLASQD
jgi:putative serine protease PepD